ncbi:MAG: hypothetical protein HYV04_01555, partial [Deltaproteobacteria bacterium]|nr:hypothetical protein [Deltaproteobacteria bacterium]
LVGEIYADHPSLGAYLVSSENDIYPAAATEIHNHVTRPKVREAGGVATTP